MPTRLPPDPDLVLTVQQRRVLDQLARHLDPVKVTVLAGELSLHHNTVREHLDALIEHGLAERRSVRSGGRGRPAWAYVAVPVTPRRRVDEYLGLTGAFAEHLSATSNHPRAEARDIGRRWGERLATSQPSRRRTDPEPPDDGAADDGAADDGAGLAASSRSRLVGLLREVGFAPDANAAGDDMALRECPLLDSARAHPEVVCEVHQGLVVGALTAYGNTTDSVRLTPFAEPGACRLRLQRRERSNE